MPPQPHRRGVRPPSSLTPLSKKTLQPCFLLLRRLLLPLAVPLAILCAAVADGQTIKPGCLPPLAGAEDLWCPGDAGYMCYKIPSLVRVGATRTLLGFIEARK